MNTGFIDHSIEGLSKQVKNFCAKISNYALDAVDPADVDLVKADSKYLEWLITAKKAYITIGEAWTSFGDNSIYGTDEGIDVVQPALPTLEAAPPLVHPGFRNRFSALAADCKKSTNYSEDIGINLGIVAVVTPFKPADGKPVVKHSLHVGHPFFRYFKGNYDGVQIYKNWGDGNGFVKFDKAINPTYTDNSTLPAAGVAVVWQYKFVFLYQDEEVGTTTDVVEVLVTGM